MANVRQSGGPGAADDRGPLDKLDDTNRKHCERVARDSYEGTESVKPGIAFRRFVTAMRKADQDPGCCWAFTPLVQSLSPALPDGARARVNMDKVNLGVRLCRPRRVGRDSVADNP